MACNSFLVRVLNGRLRPSRHALPCRKRSLYPCRPCVDLFRALVFVHVARLTADEGFINFDFARQLSEGACQHGVANPMQHEQADFWGDAQTTRDLVRETPFLSLAIIHMAHSHLSRPTAILEDGADLNGVLLFAFQALPYQTGGEERIPLGTATRHSGILPANLAMNSTQMAGLEKCRIASMSVSGTLIGSMSYGTPDLWVSK